MKRIESWLIATVSTPDNIAEHSSELPQPYRIRQGDGARPRLATVGRSAPFTSSQAVSPNVATQRPIRLSDRILPLKGKMHHSAARVTDASTLRHDEPEKAFAKETTVAATRTSFPPTASSTPISLKDRVALTSDRYSEGRSLSGGELMARPIPLIKRMALDQSVDSDSRRPFKRAQFEPITTPSRPFQNHDKVPGRTETATNHMIALPPKLTPTGFPRPRSQESESATDSSPSHSHPRPFPNAPLHARISPLSQPFARNVDLSAKSNVYLSNQSGSQHEPRYDQLIKIMWELDGPMFLHPIPTNVLLGQFKQFCNHPRTPEEELMGYLYHHPSHFVDYLRCAYRRHIITFWEPTATVKLDLQYRRVHSSTSSSVPPRNKRW